MSRRFNAAILLTLAVLTAPAFAEDCATVKSAMIRSGHTPHTLTITKTDDKGKTIVTHQVQTMGNRYVQLPDGKWYAMNIATKDLNDDLSGVWTCRRGASESVAGESAAIYDVHRDHEGEIRDSRIWVSSKNLILKTEGKTGGSRYSSAYDFDHATPPAGATTLGGR